MNQQRIWAYYQSSAPEIFHGAGYRLDHLASYLLPRQKVLNVGFGAGILESFAHARGADVHTLDPDWASLGTHSGDGISRLIAGRLQAIPIATDTFDAVVVSEVLEHLSAADMQPALAEIRRILVPGGRIIGTVPFKENLSENTVICPNCGEVFHKVGHLQAFDLKSIMRVLSHHFEEPRCFRHAFMAKARRGWKERTVGFIRNLLVLSGILTRDQQIVFLARKQHEI